MHVAPLNGSYWRIVDVNWNATHCMLGTTGSGFP